MGLHLDSSTALQIRGLFVRPCLSQYLTHARGLVALNLYGAEYSRHPCCPGASLDT